MSHRETASAAQTNLTRNQHLMWLGQQLHPDVPLYNMVFTYRVQAEIDHGCFRRAFQQVVNHCDILRTVIEVVDGGPRQRVLAELDYDLDVVDLSERSAPEQALGAWLNERMQRLHHFACGLFDSALLKVGSGDYVWYFNQHHIAGDAWSHHLIYQRVSRAYALAERGELASDATPSNTYQDYVAHEKRVTAGTARDASTYWADRLARPAEALTFYGSPAPRTTTSTRRLRLDLGAARTRALRALAEDPNVRSFGLDLTLFNLFATAFGAYLHRISARPRFNLGAPVSNRTDPRFAETPGLLIEVAALQFQLEPDETFRSLLGKVSRETLQVLRHTRPGTSSAALNRSYDALLNYLNMTYPDFAGRRVEVDWLHNGHGDVSHKLRLQVHHFGGPEDFTLLFDFNQAIFTGEQMSWATRHFTTVLDALIDDLDTSIGAVSLLTQTEARINLNGFNATDAAYPRENTVAELFEKQAAETPEAVAVELRPIDETTGPLAWTYRELNERANRLSHHLGTRGVGPGTLVGICMDHSLDVVAAILGVLKSGGAYLPIDPAFPEVRKGFLLADSGARVLLTQPQLVDRLPPYSGAVIALDFDEFSTKGSPDNPTKTTTPDDLAYVIYTSGSTGRPKGARVRHRSLVNYVWWAQGYYLEGRPVRFALCTSLSVDLTITSIFVPIVTGGRTVVYPQDRTTKGLSILRVIEDNAVEMIKLTPAHLALMRESDLSRSRIRKLIVGGEDLQAELARSISERSLGRIAIYNEYGPTETTVGAMAHRYDPRTDTRPSVSIGRPIANARIYVLDGYRRTVPLGATGEIYIGGEGVADGYHDRPELTAERFVDNPFAPGTKLYVTGDRARWDAPGEIAFLGRADHQVKIGGARVELGEIEAAMLDHPGIEQAVASVVELAGDTAEPARHCIRCGLPANYPGITYDETGLCHICRDFDGYKNEAQRYFKSMNDFRDVAAEMEAARSGAYDCLLLLSGGKDSTYVLYQLVEHHLNPLVFTLDNGFLSEGAKDNIRRVVSELGVDHVFGTSPAMNAIFKDSLERFSNVCQGCFKTIYTLALNLAEENRIGFIVTGLSRGQFFETRLTPDLFRAGSFDPDRIDKAVLEARVAYHRQDDVPGRLLDTRRCRDERLFDRIRFVDFYRYCDVEIEEVYRFLAERAPWIRPADTGRSTNCRINDVGIYTHKRERGYHNYALPYSWDVRLGHKRLDDIVHELDDEIALDKVEPILDEIGYTPNPPARAEKQLAVHFVARSPVSPAELRTFAQARLPDYMVPRHFVALDALPLLPGGKVDRTALPVPDAARPELAQPFVAPRSELETQLADIWARVLRIGEVGVLDRFTDLGGHSLPALQVMAGIRERFWVDVSLAEFFSDPTIAHLADLVESEIRASIANMTDEEAHAALQSFGD